jgi:GxxExxY protein
VKNGNEGKYSDITEKVIGCFYIAYNELGYGFLERVYGNALEILFREAGLSFIRECPIDIIFHEVRIATFRADFLMENVVLLELKAGPEMPDGSRAQLANYLTRAKREVGLILFFGPEPEVQRVSM